MSTTPTTTTKPCDDCQTPAPYEPLDAFGGVDLGKLLPHRCDDCRKAHDAAVREREQNEKIDRMRATYERTVPEIYRDTDIEHPHFPRADWQRLKAQLDISQSLALIGPPGRCKTRILALLAKRAVYREQSIGWVRTHQLEEIRLQRASFKTSDEAGRLLRHLKTCRVLVLDDLGKSPWSPAFEATLFDLLEYRYSTHRVTHWSLNPVRDDYGLKPTREIMERALDPSGRAIERPSFDAILDRLHHNTLILALS